MLTQQRKLNEDLLWAARQGNIKEMGALLRQNAYIDYPNDDGYTPLFETVCKQNIEATRFLLSKGANPNARNYRRETPLMFARTSEIIKLLAEYKVNPLLRNDDGVTAYELFFINKKLELIKAWNAAGLQRPNIAVKVYSNNDNFKNVKRCMIHMGKMEKQLFTAVCAGDMPQIKYLVKEKGVNVNIATKPDKIRPLMIAAKANNVSVVRLLLELGADAEEEDYLERNALDYAFKFGSEEALLEIIGHAEELDNAS